MKSLIKSAGYFIVFTALIVLNSCETPEPYAAFDPNMYSHNPNTEVYFYNNSRDAESYLWDFGDGQTSTEETPSHYYSDTGNYTVSLTAYNKNKAKSDKFEVEIKIKEPEVFLYAIQFSNVSDTHFDGTQVGGNLYYLFNIYLNNDTVYSHQQIESFYSNGSNLIYLRNDDYSNYELLIDKFDETYELEIFSYSSQGTYKSLDKVNFSYSSNNIYEDLIYFGSQRGTNITLRNRIY